MTQIAGNVREFIYRASTLFGRWSEGAFEMQMTSQCADIESPIEQLVWIACRLWCEVCFEDFNPEPISAEFGGLDYPPGVYLRPQTQIGSYRVDFHLVRICPHGKTESVLIELDGHQFHDRDAKQRAYEKARDRFFVKQGYRVLHFTGSEVVADPLKVAHEALSLVGAVWDEPYDPTNPIGVE